MGFIAGLPAAGLMGTVPLGKELGGINPAGEEELDELEEELLKDPAGADEIDDPPDVEDMATTFLDIVSTHFVLCKESRNF